MVPAITQTIQLSVIELPTLIDITLSASRTEIGINGESQISITNNPLTFVGTFTYSVNNSSFATVSTSGLVTGVSAGTVIVTVTSVEFSLVSNTITLTVTSVLEYKNNENFNLGQTTSYTTNSNGVLSSAGFTWKWADARNADPLINASGGMLRYDKSFYQTTVTGGISSFSVDFAKAFTGTSARQILIRLFDGTTTLEFTGEQFGTDTAADTTLRNLSQVGIELSGTITITITQNFSPSTTSRQMNIYAFRWNGYSA
jgi:hypothetical protein